MRGGGPRDRQREETRERLFRAALEEMRRTGVAAAQVDRIVAAAAVSRGSFYFHFPTKEDVLREWERRREEELTAQLTRPRSGTPLTLRDALLEVLRFLTALATSADGRLLLDVLAIHVREGADPETSVLAGPNSPLVVYGDTSQDGVWYSGHSYDRLGLEFGPKPFNPFPHLPDEENEDDEWVFPIANPFTYAGNDIIDARALFSHITDPADLPSVGFTAYGGAGNDLIYGSQAGDHPHAIVVRGPSNQPSRLGPRWKILVRIQRKTVRDVMNIPFVKSKSSKA